MSSTRNNVRPGRYRTPPAGIDRENPLLGVALLTALALPAAASAQSAFVRGDITGDQAVDVGDLTGFLGYYFGAPGSLGASNIDALDVNGDGARSVTDFVRLSRYLFLDGPPPAAPFPGSGLPPVRPVPLPPEDYLFYQVEDAVGTPGGTIAVPIYMTYLPDVEPPPPVISYTIGVRFDPSYLALTSITIPPAVAALNPELDAPAIGKGEGRIAVLFDATRIDHGLPPGENVPVALLHFSVQSPPSGAPTETSIDIVDDVFSTGTYDRSLYTEATIGLRMVRPQTARGRVFIDTGATFVRGDFNADGVVDVGDMVQLLESLSVHGQLPAIQAAADFNDDGMFSFGDFFFGAFVIFGQLAVPTFPAPFPNPGTAPLKSLPARSALDELKIEDGELLRGRVTDIPVKMTSSSRVDGFTVSLTWDPSRIDVSAVDLDPALPPTAVEPVIIVDSVRGVILVSAAFQTDLAATANLPIVHIEAQPIDFTERYTHFAFRDVSVPPLSHNEFMRMRSGGASVRPTFRSGVFACNVEFRRGDCNGDGSHDIADPITMLACKFAGQRCFCIDACNVNDDSWFDISDPVFLLNYLFSGGPAPRPPFPGCGVDPTPANDPFPFCGRSSCP